MNKFRLYVLLSILPFLAIMTSVKAYDFNSISKISRVDMGLYYDSTQLYQVSCTSSNDGYCGLEDSDLPNASNTYNNLRFVLRGNLNKTFTVGTQYKISWYFYQYTAGYFIRGADITQVTGNTYRDFTNWTSDSITILTYNLSLIESDSNKGLYRMDITFIPSTTNIAGFNFRLYSDYETISNDNGSYLEGTRYLQIVQLSADSPDYTQDLNNINQNISDLSDNISDSTQDIIDNQNQNTQNMIDSQLVCKEYDKGSIAISNSTLNSSGVTTTNNNYGVTDYIKVDQNTKIYINIGNGFTHNMCFYSNTKSFISCVNYSNVSNGQQITIPNNAIYFRASIQKIYNQPTFYICVNGNQAITDSLTDDDIGGANSSASNFFSNFTTETYGLTSVITSPLTFIQSLTSKTCSSLVLPLPYVNRNLELPCMRGIYEQHFGGFLSIYQTITFGIISYWVVVRIFNLVKDFKNPDHDEIEVMDL